MTKNLARSRISLISFRRKREQTHLSKLHDLEVTLRPALRLERKPPRPDLKSAPHELLAIPLDIAALPDLGLDDDLDRLPRSSRVGDSELAVRFLVRQT